MRGKVNHLLGGGDANGITPAYAGKRKSAFSYLSRFWDHPRVCGEKAQNVLSFWPMRGSPPRMRGKDQRAADHPSAGGITPAYAGKRGGFCRKRSESGDHPRVCGEKTNMPELKGMSVGSPPRMRGKAPAAAPAAQQPGITPAYAGKRTGDATDEETFGDHPRVCGEKPYFIDLL